MSQIVLPVDCRITLNEKTPVTFDCSMIKLSPVLNEPRGSSSRGSYLNKAMSNVDLVFCASLLFINNIFGRKENENKHLLYFP